MRNQLIGKISVLCRYQVPILYHAYTATHGYHSYLVPTEHVAILNLALRIFPKGINRWSQDVEPSGAVTSGDSN